MDVIGVTSALRVRSVISVIRVVWFTVVVSVSRAMVNGTNVKH